MTGKWEKGIWIPDTEAPVRHIANKTGHNQHTPKDKLKKVQPHKYSIMNKEQQFEELKRLYTEKRYYQAMALSYAQRIAFLMEKIGIEPKKSEADDRAEKDFKAKEG